MNRHQTIANWVAVLFIIGTAASVAGDMMLAPLKNDPMAMQMFAQNMPRVVSATLLFLTACLAIAAIPIVWFPLLRRHSETGALLYFAARLVESILYLFGAVILLGLVHIGRTGSPDQTLFDVLIRLSGHSLVIGTMLVFGISALILARLLYQTKLVPRWLSIWKAIGAVLLFVQGILILFEIATPIIESTLFLPIAVNEMVLAIWLLVVGFSPGAVSQLRQDQ